MLPLGTYSPCKGHVLPVEKDKHQQGNTRIAPGTSDKVAHSSLPVNAPSSVARGTSEDRQEEARCHGERVHLASGRSHLVKRGRSACVKNSLFFLVAFGDVGMLGCQIATGASEGRDEDQDHGSNPKGNRLEIAVNKRGCTLEIWHELCSVDDLHLLVMKKEKRTRTRTRTSRDGGGFQQGRKSCNLVCS